MKLALGRQVIGVELRDGALNAVLCRRAWNRVRAIGTLRIPQADAMQAEQVAAQFAEWRARNGADSAPITVVLPRDLLITRSLLVPHAPGASLRGVLDLQIEYLHPYESEEVLWDFSTGTAASGAAAAREGEGLRRVPVRVAIARRGAAMECVEWLRRRGMAVSQLTAPSEVARGIHLPETLDRRQAVLCLSQGNHMDLVAAPDPAEAGQAAAVLLEPESTAAQLAARIAQGLAGLKSPDVPAGEMPILAVGGSLIESGELWAQIRSELAQSFQVVELDPFSVAEAAARTALATEPGGGFNLLPEGDRHYEPTVNMIPTFALATLVIVLGVLLSLQPTLRGLRENNRLDAELEGLRPQVAAISARQDRMSRAHERLLLLKGARESARVPLDVLEEVSQRLPNQAWLQQFQMDGRTATFSGNAASASEVLQSLSDAAQLEAPQFLSAILRGNDGQESFRIGARVRPGLR